MSEGSWKQFFDYRRRRSRDLDRDRSRRRGLRDRERRRLEVDGSSSLDECFDFLLKKVLTLKTEIGINFQNFF